MPDFSVARIKRRAKDDVGKFERHIERKNDTYENMNVDLNRTPMNIHFKSCGDMTYNETLDKLVADGTVSLRGLKKGAKVYDEMILDVNTDYFERNGGYEYAKRFYEEAYRFAVKLYGEENILSAVMHADEVNLFLSDLYGYPVYHYHMHIMALPVVEKEIKWSKRCKDKALVGTVKEVIRQVSHSKKWKSPQAVDEQGKPMYDEKGKAVLIPTYSLLQDRFFEHMRDAGFTGFERGERGSGTENLSCTEYKLQQDKKHLAEMEDKISAANEDLKAVLPVRASVQAIDSIGRKTLTGKVQMSAEDYAALSNLAKECLVNRRTIQILESSIAALKEKVQRLETALSELTEKCKPYLEALKAAPQKVKEFIGGVLEAVQRKKSEQADKLLYKPAEKKKYEPSPWELQIPAQKPKTKKRDDLER
ncbi:MAG: plasmid recombination protein [Ruminococcus sp.]